MRKIFVMLFLLPFVVFAQKSSVPANDYILMNQLTGKQDVPIRQKVNFDPANPDPGVKAYYMKLSELQNLQSQLKLISQIQSPVGSHLFYRQYFNGIPVYGAYLKVNLGKSGEQLSAYNHLYNSENWQAQSFNGDASMGEKVYMVNNGILIPAFKKMANGKETLSDVNGVNLFERDLKCYFSNDDTVVTSKVFRPDPLSMARVTYGDNETYKHFNDSDYALLNDQRFDVNFPATLDGDTFRLQNKYCIVMDHILPTNIPAVSLTPDFTFTRGANGFKDAMVMYHIYNLQQYLQSIGWNNLVNWQLKVDPFSGYQDNSYFQVDVDTTLNLGIGGVPDAEDADVITHEYTHAIRFGINPEFPSSADRWAVEEGICDVMAATYSRAYSDFQWRNIYNWDGHNQFWPGRDANRINASLGRMKVYSDRDGERYYDCEIWSSCLLDIYEEIGRDKLIKLMLTSIYSFTPNTTMPEAATIFMQADSILFGSADIWRLGKYFKERELGDFPTGINDVTNSSSFIICNTAGFADGSGDAMVDVNEPSNITVYNLKGQKIYELKHASGQISIPSVQFQSGLYFMTIENNQGKNTVKLNRF